MSGKIVETFEIERPTQRKIRFLNCVLVGKERKEVFYHPHNYEYIGKGMWQELGGPARIRVTIEAILPEDGDAKDNDK